jgi:hypothetical protein
MAKKQSGGEASAEAAKRRRSQGKTAAPKAGARKPAAKAAKPGKSGKSDDKKPAKKARESAQAELPIAKAPVGAAFDRHEADAAADLDEVDDIDDIDVVEDADIVAETPAEAGEPAVNLARSRTEEVIPVDDQPPTLSPEEQELTALYGDDLSQPARVHTEYSDRLTADEDRPMVPEINARDERKQQWQERRDRRRQRRDERDRQRQERREHQNHARGNDARGNDGRGNDGRDGRDRQHAPGTQAAQPPPGQGQGQPRPVAPSAPSTNGQSHDALARVGTPLGDAAATVFAQLRNGQPLPVRQLAAMMRKRSLVEIDPEQLWPQLKAELLGDERSYRTLGLRPRIVYRGRDLFAPGPVAMSQTADAEANVAAALSRLAGATHRALAGRIARANGAGFERLIHAYLVAAGYRDIAWVKRVGGISYAQAIAPGIDRAVLISARSGDQAIDRRGIGELRVGVEAKDLVAGILFSARELSEDAERELERAGRSVAVICGDQLVATLIAAGVGVVSAAAPLHYVDDQLLDELLAG